MDLPIEHLFLVIIAPGSQMLLEKRTPVAADVVGGTLLAGITEHLSLPYISYVNPAPAIGGVAPAIHGNNVLADQKNLQTVLQSKISTTAGLSSLGAGISSRFRFCDSRAAAAALAGVAGTEAIPPAVVLAGGAKAPNEYCAILHVTDAEKGTIQGNPNLRFYQTYTVAGTPPVKTFNPALAGLNMLSRRMFSSFVYAGAASPLDACIAAAPAAPVPATTKTITYRFYRPVFPFYGLPYVVSPYGSPYGSPRSSPRFSNRSPERTTFPNGSPVVSRSSRSPIVRRLQEDEYYQKYLKYKAKYMKLKSSID